MRIQAVLLAALIAGATLLAFAPPGAQAAVPTLTRFEVQRANGTAMPVPGLELGGNETTVLFNATANTTGSTNPQAELVLRLKCGTVGCHTIRRLMVRSQDNWTLNFSNRDADLIVGVYDAEVQFSSGSEVAVRTTNRTFTVTATDTTPPALSLSGGGNRTEVGPGEVVRIIASDDLLWKVSYQFNGLPAETLLTAPYALSSGSFAEGTNRLTFRAYDRAGYVTSMPAIVVRDSLAPTLSFTATNKTYLGVPIDISAMVTDASNVTLSLVYNGTQSVLVQPGGGHTFRLTPAALGNTTYTLRGVDPFGSESTVVGALEVLEPYTAVGLGGLTVTPSTVLLGEQVVARASVIQAQGVVPVQVRVTIANATPHDLLLPLANVSYVEDTFRPRLGVHTYNATVQLLSAIPELNGTNHNASATFEVFLGRVVNGTQTYHIRADERGFPLEAVDASGRRLNLSLQELGSGVVYAFNVTGGSLYWDPLRQTTDLTPAPATTPPGAPEPKENAPGAGLVAIVAAIALAFLARRRK